MESLRNCEGACRGLMSAVMPLVQYITDITKEIRAGGDSCPTLREVEASLIDRVQAVGRAAVAEVVSGYEPTAELVDVGGRVYPYSFRIHETPRSRMTFRSRRVPVALGLV